MNFLLIGCSLTTFLSSIYFPFPIPGKESDYDSLGLPECIDECVEDATISAPIRSCDSPAVSSSNRRLKALFR
jgi:hypothetical protein